MRHKEVMRLVLISLKTKKDNVKKESVDSTLKNIGLFVEMKVCCWKMRILKRDSWKNVVICC